MRQDFQSNFSQLPQSGWFTAEEWARSFEIEPKTFRTQAKKLGIPYLVFGNAMIIRAEDLYARLKSISPNESDE